MILLRALLLLSLLLCACAGSGSDATADYPEYVTNAIPPSYEGSELVRNLSYPPQAIERGIEGTVYVQVKINEKGKVVDAVVVKRVDRLLDEAAVDAIRKTTFTPAMLDGEPIRMQRVIPVMFKLSE